MGRALIRQILPAIEQLEWRGAPVPTAAGALVFRTTVEQVDSYRGDPRVLGLALRTARTTDSLPYAYAATAYILLAAAGPEGAATTEDSPETHDRAGLDAALSWLEKAQELAPDEAEINVIEALIYIYGQRSDDARTILDYLHGEAPESYALLRAEMSYWQQVGDHEQALAWNGRAFEEASTVPQRLRLKSAAAAIYRQAGNLTQALQAYQEALHFDQNNAWLCHQISLLYYEQDAPEEAALFNERALKLQPDFAEAQQFKEQFTTQQRHSGLLGRFFG